MKSRRIKAISAVLACVAVLCSCNSLENPRVTFKEVTTEGITAFTTSGGNTTSEPLVIITTTPSSEGSDSSDSSVSTTVNSPENTTTAPSQTTTTTTTTTPPATTTTKPTTTTTQGGSGVTGSYNKIGENGILVSLIDGHYWGLMPCFGTYGLCDSWTASVNTFAEKLPNVNVYNMVVPTSSEFYVPESITGFTTSQFNKIDYVREGLKDVTNVDAYSKLKAHTSEQIFSRTDHHWFPLGAYYAAEAFADVSGIKFPDISEYKKVTKGGYVGSMYTYSRDKHLYNDPEDFTMYLPPNYNELKTTYYNTSFGGGYDSNLFTSPDGGAYYCSFLGSDDRIAEIETGVKNGKVLVIFKESYGNAVVPFLTSGFEKIYVCDLRYFTPNAVSFCKKVGATDLLFSVCTYTAAGTNGNYLKYILNQ